MKRLLLLCVACSSASPEAPSLPADLAPVPADLLPGEQYYVPQPVRTHPYEALLVGSKVYVTLRGSEAEPDRRIAVVDANAMTVSRIIEVGSSPNALALHPDQKHLVVLNRFSAYLSVIDVHRDEVIAKIPTPYYATSLVFDPDGARAYLTNRWLDSVLVYDVVSSEAGLSFSLRTVPSASLRDLLRDLPGIPVGTNPRDLVYDPLSKRVFVANMPDLTVSVIDAIQERVVGTLDLGAPVNDLAVVDGTLIVATTNRATGHPMDEGPDTDGDGQPGDGTPNRHFHDLQNELALYDTRSLEPRVRYTSDSIAGFFEDVPEGTPGLAEPALRVVRGSLPEQIVDLGGGRIAVSMAASGELSVYRVSGASLSFEAVFEVGLFPYGVTGAGDRVFVANRNSEELTRVEIGTRDVRRIGFGAPGVPPFPATDAELGELVMNMTAVFAADGDASCEHCHREANGIRRVASAPHAVSKFATRSMPTMRNLLKTRPLMFENFLNETNFSPMMNEFGRAENFGPGNPRADFPSRPEFFMAMAEKWGGRRQSFGDAIPSRPIDFEGAAALLGIALIHEPRLLPNPNPRDSFAVERGRRLFDGAQTSCGACHPAPSFAITTDNKDLGFPLAMKMFSTGRFGADDTDALTQGVRTRFGVNSDEFGVPSLRGLWDRPPWFYHDARGKGLIPALATPGHPALLPGQVGVNERDGVLDIHGGTSHLSAGEMRDLVEYLESIE